MYVYRPCARTGQLVLLSMAKDFQNPAFLRYHPEVRVLRLRPRGAPRLPLACPSPLPPSKHPA